MSTKIQIAAVQMVSGVDVDNNLQVAASLIEQAAGQGAELVLLPEYFCLLGQNDTDKLQIREQFGSGVLQDFLSAMARQNKIWLIGGTIPLISPDNDRIYNASLVYNPSGEFIFRYDKIHLFGLNRGAESFNESATIKPGENYSANFSMPFANTVIGTCYDLRFPEFFRAQGDFNLIALPAAFTYTTGLAHWEILLRARAIENQCYVLASAQGGKHQNGRRTWGHSMLIDPWGEVIDCLPEGEGIVSGELDQQYLAKIRQSLPALKHRVM